VRRSWGAALELVVVASGAAQTLVPRGRASSSADSLPVAPLPPPRQARRLLLQTSRLDARLVVDRSDTVHKALFGSPAEGTSALYSQWIPGHPSDSDDSCAGWYE
jgi:hypothetical protein